jgi:excisionase family DNA binding protein
VPKESLTIKEVANVLSCHWQTVRSLINDGKLPAFRVGRHVRVAKIDLLAFRGRNKYQRRKTKRNAASVS